MDGKITEYDPFKKRGIVSGPDGEHAFDASADLASELSNTIIPPDAPVDVTYDVAGTGEAINVRLAHTVDLAASADPMAIRSFAVAKSARPQPAIPQPATAPAKKAKKKSAGKKAPAKKPPARKSPAKKTSAKKSPARKLPSKPAPKKRRP